MSNYTNNAPAEALMSRLAESDARRSRELTDAIRNGRGSIAPPEAEEMDRKAKRERRLEQAAAKPKTVQPPPKRFEAVEESDGRWVVRKAGRVVSGPFRFLSREAAETFAANLESPE